MAVSLAVVPLLKGEAAKSLMNTLEKAKLKPYKDEQRKKTDERMEQILLEREENWREL